MLENIHFYSPPQLRAALESLPYSRVVFVAGPNAVQRAGLDGLINGKEKTGWVWVRDVVSNPTQYTLAKALALLGGHPGQAYIALGGGSAIDLAKAMAALQSSLDATPEGLLAAVKGKTYQEPGLIPDIIAIPTTAGTGSEVTHWATLWDRDGHTKYSVDEKALMPKEAWLVPALTVSLSPRTTLSTGLDAACQAAEAYWAKSTDPLAQALALQAIQMIRKHLSTALSDGQNLEARTGMCTASLVSGLAFSRTRTTACHSISYPLTALYGIEHGFAASLTLAPVAAVNGDAVDIAPLLAAFGADIQAWLDGFCAGIQPLRLSAFGVGKEDIPTIAENAFTTGRMDNNPVPLGEKEVEAILRQVL